MGLFPIAKSREVFLCQKHAYFSGMVLPETLYVLETGCEEKAKTSFDERQGTWKYAIKGKTIRDTLDVRVIVAFDENDMLIVTVMHIGGL